MTRHGAIYIVLCFLAALVALPAMGETASPQAEAQSPIPAESPGGGALAGLQISVMEEDVTAGSVLELQWEIVPDDLRAVSLVLGIILPDGSVRYYEGVKDGFTELDDVARARRIVKNFPFNTRMSGVLKIGIPSGWAAGDYQFICFVCEGTTCADIVYSNTFRIVPGE